MFTLKSIKNLGTAPRAPIEVQSDEFNAEALEKVPFGQVRNIWLTVTYSSVISRRPPPLLGLHLLPGILLDIQNEVRFIFSVDADDINASRAVFLSSMSGGVVFSLLSLITVLVVTSDIHYI